jgi:GT2 family glycosyltransferase
MNKILIILLNYKTPQMTLRAARATVRAMRGLQAELVIVDNDSADGSFEQMHEALLEADWAQEAPIRLVQSGHNGGFGAGNNVGIRMGMADGSPPDYVYIQNSDAFPEPDAIARLAQHLDAHPRAGMVGSYIKGEDGQVQLSTFRFPSVWSELEGSVRFGPVTWLLSNKSVPRPMSETQEVDWLAGASVMMRQSMLDDIGLFDETFFLYFEETELCLRAARAGYERHYVHDSVVTHIGSASTGMGRWARVPQYWLNSRWYYFRKSHGPTYAVFATVMHLIGGTLWRFRRQVQRKSPADPPKFLRDLLIHDLKALWRGPQRRQL